MVEELNEMGYLNDLALPVVKHAFKILGGFDYDAPFMEINKLVDENPSSDITSDILTVTVLYIDRLLEELGIMIESDVLLRDKLDLLEAIKVVGDIDPVLGEGLLKESEAGSNNSEVLSILIDDYVSVLKHPIEEMFKSVSDEFIEIFKVAIADKEFNVNDIYIRNTLRDKIIKHINPTDTAIHFIDAVIDHINEPIKKIIDSVGISNIINDDDDVNTVSRVITVIMISKDTALKYNILDSLKDRLKDNVYNSIRIKLGDIDEQE